MTRGRSPAVSACCRIASRNGWQRHLAHAPWLHIVPDRPKRRAPVWRASFRRSASTPRHSPEAILPGNPCMWWSQKIHRPSSRQIRPPASANDVKLKTEEMMTDQLRIAAGGFSHETNTFSPLWTELEDFEVVRGDALLR